MAKTQANITYKVYNGTDWDTLYFQTTAGSVIESTTKRFLVPSTHTVNGQSFFDGTTAKGIVLTGENIKLGTTDETTINNAISGLNEEVEGLKETVNGLPGTLVSSITTPLKTGATGNVDLTEEFALYLPLAGGTMGAGASINFSNGGGISNASGISTNNLTVASSATITNAIITNLTVRGTTTTVDVENVEIKDNLLTLAKDNNTALVTPSGIVVPKYDGTNSGALYFDSTGTAYVGDVNLDDNGSIITDTSGALPLVVRDKVLNVEGGEIAEWSLTSDGFPQLTKSAYNWSDTLKNGTILTYNNSKTKVAGSLTSNETPDSNNKYILNLLALDGTTSLGTFELGTASKLSSTEAIVFESGNTELPTAKAVVDFIKQTTNRVFYQSTTPSGTLKIGDLWFDTTNATLVS